MITRFIRGGIVCAALSLPVAAQAGPLRMVFDSGEVSIDADAVSLHAILDEWSRLGGTRVDGIEKLPDAVITLHLAAMAEGQALAAVLLGRNGYGTAPRKPGETGASQFSRIVLLSPSAPPAAAGTPARRGVVPPDWPFPVNEHPADTDLDAPKAPSASGAGVPGIDVPWPFPVNPYADIDSPVPAILAVPVEGTPGIDVPWPFPVNEHPELPAAAAGAAATTGSGAPGIEIPWPFPVSEPPVTGGTTSVAPGAGAGATSAPAPEPGRKNEKTKKKPRSSGHH